MNNCNNCKHAFYTVCKYREETSKTIDLAYILQKTIENSLGNNSQELVCNTVPILKDNVCTSFLEKEDSNTPTISCVFSSKE